MGITINITEGAGAAPAVAATGFSSEPTSIDAGASVGFAPAAGQGGTGPAGITGQRFDGGAPPPALVQEVEAALRRIATGAMAAPAASDSLNAGSAPF
jgi:hypothetical protein